MTHDDDVDELVADELEVVDGRGRAGTETDAVSEPTVASTGGSVTEGRPPELVVRDAPGTVTPTPGTLAVTPGRLAPGNPVASGTGTVPPPGTCVTAVPGTLRNVAATCTSTFGTV